MVDGLAWVFFYDFYHFARQICCTFTAFGKALVFGIMCVALRAPTADHLQFIFGIEVETVEGDHNGLTELLEVVHMSLQV